MNVWTRSSRGGRGVNASVQRDPECVRCRRVGRVEKIGKKAAMFEDSTFWLFVAPGLLLGLYAQARIKANYMRYSRVGTSLPSSTIPWSPKRAPSECSRACRALSMLS